jgi:acyl carrier protein/GNAT superfamily N-acetyltransferase
MTRSLREDELVQILRAGVLSGSDRDIPVDHPVGHLGLGLDSLALVEFVTALEKRYQIVLPDSLWIEAGQLTIRRLADFVDATLPAAAHRSRRRPLPSRWRHSAANSPYLQLLRERVQKQGVIRTLWWAYSGILSRLVRRCYSRSTFVVLARDLDTFCAPNQPLASNLELREMSRADLPSLRSLWPSHSSSRMLDLFHQRHAAGFVCLVAVRASEIVGIDWLSATGDHSPETGVTIFMKTGSCYALDLYEKYAGEGIGLALLTYSLVEAKRRGFHSQLGYVDSRNIPMLSAAVQLLGYRTIGSIRTTTSVFAKPSSRWQLEDPAIVEIRASSRGQSSDSWLWRRRPWPQPGPDSPPLTHGPRQTGAGSRSPR